MFKKILLSTFVLFAATGYATPAEDQAEVKKAFENFATATSSANPSEYILSYDEAKAPGDAQLDVSVKANLLIEQKLADFQGIIYEKTFAEYDREKLVEKLFDTMNFPFFCERVTAVIQEKADKEAKKISACKAALNEFLDKVDKHAEHAYMAHVKGDTWGDYEGAFLVIGWEGNPTLITIEFDIVHEI